MGSDAWDDDDQDQSPPRPKVDIGQDVRVFRPATDGVRSRKVAWVVAAGPLMAAIAVLGYVVFKFHLSGNSFSPPPAAAFIVMGGFLAATLIALPGLMKLGKEQATSELRIGDLGMEMLQTLIPGKPPMQVWAVLWKDMGSAKLHYRDPSDPEYGLVVTSRTGETQVLRPADWVSADGQGAMPMSAGSALIPVAKPGRRQLLEQSELVQALQQKSVKVEDDVPRPQDRLAAIIGLSLGIGAILAALIFSYFVEK